MQSRGCHYSSLRNSDSMNSLIKFNSTYIINTSHTTFYFQFRRLAQGLVWRERDCPCLGLADGCDCKVKCAGACVWNGEIHLEYTWVVFKGALG